MPELLCDPMFALCYLCYLAFASLLFWELFTVSPFDPCLEMFPQDFLFISFSFYHLFSDSPYSHMAVGLKEGYVPCTVSGAEPALKCL